MRRDSNDDLRSPAVTTVCECGHQFVSANKIAVPCPTCGTAITLGGARSQPKRIGQRERNHWLPLHQYAPANRYNWDASKARVWYMTWKSQIAKYTGCGSCPEHFDQISNDLKPDYSSPEAFAHRAWQWHDKVSDRIGKPRISWDECQQLYSPEPVAVQHLLTYDDLTRDTLSLAQLILRDHPDVAGIAGCPRSGLRAAADISIRLGLPLYEASKEHGLRSLSPGLRLRRPLSEGERRPIGGPIVIVEDSTCSGHSVNELRSRPELADLPIYAVYGASPGRHAIDGCADHRELPHWFDWNLWGNAHIMRDFNTAIDWDGVLNPDCTVEQDDDGLRYIDWLTNVSPIRLPRTARVPYIITARREAYRQQAEAWLAKHRINYGELVMFPGSFMERGKTCIGTWKAQKAKEHGARMFIESSAHQARVIADTGLIEVVISIET